MIGVLVLLVLLSLKADTADVDDAQQQSSNNIMYKYVNMLVPCIDYVSWNGDGELADGSVTTGSVTTGGGNQSMHTRTNNSSNDVDIEMGGSSNNNAERYPLLSSSSQQSSSLIMSNSGSSSDDNAIRGRIPIFSSSESDLSRRQ